MDARENRSSGCKSFYCGTGSHATAQPPQKQEISGVAACQGSATTFATEPTSGLRAQGFGFRGEDPGFRVLGRQVVGPAKKRDRKDWACQKKRTGKIGHACQGSATTLATEPIATPPAIDERCASKIDSFRFLRKRFGVSSVGPSICPICTRCCFMVQVCSNTHRARLSILNTRPDEIVASRRSMALG